MSRLVNCLNGFHCRSDDIQVHISDSEQIGNIIILIKNSLVDYNTSEHKKLVRERLEELGYDNEVIEEWLEFI